MKIPPLLQPFVDLARQPKEILERIQGAKFQEAQARKKAEVVMKAYRELVKSPAYKPVYDDALRAMGLNLSALVKCAMGCGKCIQFAAPVKALQEIIVEPLDQVLRDEIRERAEEEGKE